MSGKGRRLGLAHTRNGTSVKEADSRVSGDLRTPAGIAGKEMPERSECIERNSGKGQENVAEG